MTKNVFQKICIFIFLTTASGTKLLVKQKTTTMAKAKKAKKPAAKKVAKKAKKS
jgi:hypothetical protein